MSEPFFTQRFPAQAEQLHQLREWVRDFLLEHGLDASRVDQVVIGVNEAAMNIIEHAYCHQSGDIILKIHYQQTAFIIELIDFAQTVDCSKIKSRCLDDIRPGGLGVHFIQEMIDKVEYLPGDSGAGNIIRMTVNINPR